MRNPFRRRPKVVIHVDQPWPVRCPCCSYTPHDNRPVLINATTVRAKCWWCNTVFTALPALARVAGRGASA